VTEIDMIEVDRDFLALGGLGSWLIDTVRHLLVLPSINHP
jgi:hypothetical protein